MKEFLTALTRGVSKKDIPREFERTLNDLIKLRAIKSSRDFYEFNQNYKAGKIDISFNGTGFLEIFDNANSKDLLIEPNQLFGASRGDIVIVKRVSSKSRGRAKATVIYIAKRAFSTSIVYTKTQQGRVVGINIKTALSQEIVASQKSLKQLPDRTVLKISNDKGTIDKVLGTLDDPAVDEKISLELFEKKEDFSKDAEDEAKSHGDSVDKGYYPHRVDLTHLPFCTIDPPDAKDFDDAIYFDIQNSILYVAIADVSEYVFHLGPIDKEAKERGFSIYFPHKSIPMLPRSLSENICSLKPNEDRLAFTFKITLDPNTLEPLKEELMQSIIHSCKRYTYDKIDLFLSNDLSSADETDKEVLKFLLPLASLMKKSKEKRLKNAFEFRSSEIRMSVDEHQNLISTKVEVETPSHGLIEDCMLLANKAAAKRIQYGIFRTHESPTNEKLESLLNDLALIGISVKSHPDLPTLIKSIQTKADEANLREEVDKLIIKSQKKAIYEPENKGHFGLGFSTYTHFTSPIRRYSDLTLHRLLKAELRGDAKGFKFLLSNIHALCEEISKLERESDKVAWDYMDRKFARWASLHVGENFKAIVTDVEQNPIAKLEDTIIGARIFLLDSEVSLLERVEVKIVESNIATTRIYGKIVRRSHV
ncbi:MAG: ribonuclease R [Sulfurospirillaceae bacterium]|nr:ribonuclease R [Sulfurospirillaceae bacterium]MDD3463275.1 ribonuclease R [Sulfurospirillaceae bacterium]